MKPTIVHRIPTVVEYQRLRNTTNWGYISDQTVAEALQNTLFSVCVLVEDQIIAMGRIVGDGAIYFYIQDVIVSPDHKEKGLGKQVMNELDQWLNKNAPENAFIGLMAATDVAGFYRKFGYQIRPEDRPGMYRVIK